MMKRLNWMFVFIVLFCMVGGPALAWGQDVPVTDKDERLLEPLPPRVSQPDVLYLTPEQEEEALAYIKKNQPDEFEELMVWKQTRAVRYQQLVSRAFREMRFLKNLKEKDPQKYERISRERKLNRESMRLAKTYRAAEGEEEKERLENEIAALLNELFDLRQMIRKEEIDKLERKLTELRQVNQKRLDNKEAIIQRRLTELLGDRSMVW